MSGLIVVDMQRDFCAGGALECQRSDSIVHKINKLIDFVSGPIFFTRDFHEADDPSFTEWPPHCVRGTDGVKFHKNLWFARSDGIVDKIRYSGFEDIGFFTHGSAIVNELETNFPHVRHLYICGLAVEYCIRATVLDALELNFRVTVVSDACGYVEREKVLPVFRELRMAGAGFMDTETLTL